ncbi:MAG: threonine synthase [Candidatus Dormibacteraeota bacterium]|uniref:Threonine synthase n=1 Tax=Candidatus Amunia macphersoniae TaxID=3127014 RepID=A0A934KGI2_9BACT|nr:threonine synthase [Candidatus Dormibacteraeota bacterium]
MSTTNTLRSVGIATAVTDGGGATHVTGLRCRACGHEHEASATHLCELCFGPLEVAYDYHAIARRVSRAQIESGPPTLWRYRDLLPVGDGELVSLGEGFTPLVHARNLAAELGLRNLHLKNDTVNPTNSFKDRVVAVALNWALQQGYSTIACASTGNLANSVAAYAARAGIRAVVFIPADLEPQKIAATTVFGAEVIPVAGTYDDVNRLCAELADDLDWGFCNINLRPYYSEGSKTLTFEMAEQLGWRLPDEIVVPVASGCQFVKHRKAAAELVNLGLVADRRLPRFTGAQALGCSPVAAAFDSGGEAVHPVRPDTIARSIAIGNPSDGADVVRIARRTGGVVASVTEEEILEGIDLLARTEGIFTETAGGVTVAVLRKLAAAGRWRGDETVVAFITGHGLKTLDAIAGRHPLGEAILPQRRSVYGRLEELGVS